MGGATLSFCLTILFASTCVLFADASVPVFIWPRTDGNPVFALHSIDNNGFAEIIKGYTATNKPIIVYTAPTLTTNDIARRNEKQVTCFEKFSVIKKMYLPTVDKPLEAFVDMPTKTETRYITPEGELNQDIEAGSSKVYQVELPSKQPGETDLEYCGQLDRLLDHHSTKYASVATLMFTGLTGEPEPQVVSRKARSAQPADDAKATDNKQNGPPAIDPTFFKRDNLLVYYTGLFETNNKKEEIKIEITELKVDTQSDSSLHVELKGGQTTIGLDLVKVSGYWGVAKGTHNGNDLSGKNLIGAPLGFSYHCTPAIVFSVANGSETSSVIIKGLQLEPLFGSGEKIAHFSGAQDCVGFTSAGIWAGLFVTIMLLAILTIGISWIMDIRTMDRFDDPKGKTITINTAE